VLEAIPCYSIGRKPELVMLVGFQVQQPVI